MKIKLGTTEKGSTSPAKPAKSAVVAPQGVPCPVRCNVHPEFNGKLGMIAGLLFILCGIGGIVISAVVHAKVGHGCSWLYNVGFLVSIVTGGLGLGAACKKRRGVIIAFMVFAIIMMVVVVFGGIGSIKTFRAIKAMNEMERRHRHHHHRHHPHHKRDAPDHDHSRSHERNSDEMRKKWEEKMALWKKMGGKRGRWGKSKSESHDVDERRPWGKPNMNMKLMFDNKKLILGSAISITVMHGIQFILSIIAIVICSLATGCCKKQQPRSNNGSNYRIPTPAPVVVESAPLPAELDAKILSEQYYVKPQAPPINHQGEVPLVDPPAYVEDDKAKLTDVNV